MLILKRRAVLKRKDLAEKIAETAFLAAAFTSIICVVFITLFIFNRGLPLFKIVGISDFLLSSDWSPTDEENPGFGILPFIAGSIYVTLGSLALSIPVGISTAVFLAEIAKGKIRTILKSIVELLAGIPSIVYGFFGVTVICSWVRNNFGGTGYSVLSASLVLAIMTLPTIINISEVSIKAVSSDMKEGSLALGASRWQTIVKILIPGAKSGIIAGIVLGMGRAIGETMAVLMVAGNAPIMPTGPLSKVRTLTMNIVTDMGYASGDHMTALFTTSIVLFFFILGLNLFVNTLLKNKAGRVK
jgi:phosphate transport system permease protein